MSKCKYELNSVYNASVISVTPFSTYICVECKQYEHVSSLYKCVWIQVS